jgi:CubicO group peptidase (beta-lactamase class C family)
MRPHRLWAARRLALLSLLLALLAPSTQAADPLPLPLQQALHTLLAEEQLTGMVVATLQDGQVQTGGLGFAHRPSRRPMPADAKVQAGSIAKTLVSLAVLRLVSQGRLDLETPVASLLPALPNANTNANPWQTSHPLRLRHLLDMTGGLADLRLWQFFSAHTVPDQALAIAWQRDPSVLQLRTPPGLQFSYANLSHTLAAMVLEATVNERYESWMARELLQPLGMVDSTMAFTTQTGAGATARLAWGHVDDGSPVAALPLALRPAGQFTTTGADMMRLAAFLMQADGRVAGQPFIRPELLAAMGRPANTAAAQAGLRTGYALGLFTRDRYGALSLCHGGSVGGFEALWCLDRERRTAYFVGWNSDREDARHGRFEVLLVQHLGLVRPAAAAQRAAADVADWNGRYVPAPSRLALTSLPDRLLGSWRLDAHSHGGSWTPLLGPARVLVPQGEHRFRQDDRGQPTLALLRGAHGEPLVAGFGMTLRRIGTLEWAALWAGALGGATGLLYWALRPLLPWRRPWAPWRQPAWLALLLLAAAVGALALQPWQQLGDITAASVALALATGCLPLALLLQAGCSWRARGQLRLGALYRDLSACGLALGGCGLLAGFGLLPLLLWQV